MRVFISVLQNLLFVSGFSLCHHSGVCASRNPGMMQMYSSNYQPFTFKLTPNNLVNEFGKYLLNHDASDTRIWYNFYNKRNVHWNQGLIYFRFQNDVGYLHDLYIPRVTRDINKAMKYNFRYYNTFGLYYENSTGNWLIAFLDFFLKSKVLCKSAFTS